MAFKQRERVQWTPDEDKNLKHVYLSTTITRTEYLWDTIACDLGSQNKRTAEECRQRYNTLQEMQKEPQQIADMERKLDKRFSWLTEGGDLESQRLIARNNQGVIEDRTIGERASLRQNITGPTVLENISVFSQPVQGDSTAPSSSFEENRYSYTGIHGQWSGSHPPSADSTASSLSLKGKRKGPKKTSAATTPKISKVSSASTDRDVRSPPSPDRSQKTSAATILTQKSSKVSSASPDRDVRSPPSPDRKQKRSPSPDDKPSA